ncbi:hypothetical protein LRP88_11825 [Fusarium phalaenopsidis]|nr:hypothetical protein NCS56_01256300 [Fusarium sp. Ph1]
MVSPTPTYHIISRVPPPPQGPLKLGTVIGNLQDPTPLSENLHVEESRQILFRDEEFEVNLEQVLKGVGGVGLNVLDTPVGIDLSGGGETTNNDTYKFKQLDTVFVSPTLDDYKTAVAVPSLQEHLEYSGYKPVYIITGMKIGHQPQVTLRRGNQLNGTFAIGFSDSNITLGTNANASSSRNIVQGSKRSPDSIVFAIRVRKLSYKKRHFLGSQRDLHDSSHNYNAELVGVGNDEDEENEVPVFDVEEMDLDEEIKGRATQEWEDSQEGRFQLVFGGIVGYPRSVLFGHRLVANLINIRSTDSFSSPIYSFTISTI